MYHSKCTYAGCGKSFSKETQNGAAQALRMHVNRSHLRIIKSPVSGNRAILTKNQVPQISPKTGLPKRVYNRKPKPIETQSVNFCPNCGCAINSVALAMSVAQSMNGK